MPTDRWTVELDDPGRRYYPTSVMLSGLGLDDHHHNLLLDLAESILDGDERAEAWADFIVALKNLRTDSSESAEDAMHDAWDALAPELLSSLRMSLPEARHVARLLTESPRPSARRRWFRLPKRARHQQFDRVAA